MDNMLKVLLKIAISDCKSTKSATLIAPIYQYHTGSA